MDVMSLYCIFVCLFQLMTAMCLHSTSGAFRVLHVILHPTYAVFCAYADVECESVEQSIDLTPDHETAIPSDHWVSPFRFRRRSLLGLAWIVPWVGDIILRASHRELDCTFDTARLFAWPLRLSERCSIERTATLNRATAGQNSSSTLKSSDDMPHAAADESG
jgi:hypothetical protein